MELNETERARLLQLAMDEFSLQEHFLSQCIPGTYTADSPQWRLWMRAQECRERGRGFQALARAIESGSHKKEG